VCSALRGQPAASGAQDDATWRRPPVQTPPRAAPTNSPSACAIPAPSAATTSSPSSSMTSMAGIALGVMALIVVLSVMNGFQEELRDRILGVAAHMEISGPNGQWRTGRSWRVKWKSTRQVRRHGALYLRPGVAANGERNQGSAECAGLLPEEESKVAEFASRMPSGRLSDLKPGRIRHRPGRRPGAFLGAFPGDNGGGDRAQGV